MGGFFRSKKKRQRKSTSFSRGLLDFSTLYERVKSNNEQNEMEFDFSVKECALLTISTPLSNPDSSFFLIASLQEAPD